MSLEGKSRKELYDLWRKRIRIASALHKEKVIDWFDKIIKSYSGDAQSDMDTYEAYTQIAQVIHAIESIIQPHLIFQNINWVAKSKRPEWEKRERLISAILNQEYSDIKSSGHKLDYENELAMIDARILPYGVTKSTYRVEGGLLREKPDQAVLDKFKDVLRGRPPEFIETPVIEKEIGLKTERLDPRKVMLDYSANNIAKQKWHIEILHKSKEELSRPPYNQDMVKDLEADTVLMPSFQVMTKTEQERLMQDPDFKGFTVYEIHDVENSVIHSVLEKAEDFVEFATKYPVDEGSLYSFLSFKDIPNQVYPVPPVKFYKERAREYSYALSEISKQLDKFMPKIGYNINAVDKAAKDVWKHGSLGALVPFTSPPAGQWDQLNPRVSDDLFKYLALTKELLFLESGAADFEVATPDASRTATEAAIMQKSVLSRRSHPRKRVKEFYESQANTIVKLLQKNASEEHFVKVLGNDEAMEWWKDPETGKSSWTKESIPGDYWYSLNLEEITPQNETDRKKQNEQNMITAMNPNLKQGLVEEGKELLLSNVFAKFSEENMGIKDRDKLWRDLKGLEPGDEHTLWMVGTYPQISEREMKDPKFLMKHFQAHNMFIESPAFSSLPIELQQEAIQHRDSYIPHLMRLQEQENPQAGKRPQSQPEGPDTQEGKIREEALI